MSEHSSLGTRVEALKYSSRKDGLKMLENLNGLLSIDLLTVQHNGKDSATMRKPP